MKLEQARICQPEMSSLQCTQLALSGLPCGCETFVNPANELAATELEALLSAWQAQECMQGYQCEACPEAPTSAYCEETPPGASAPGFCRNSL